jgi:zinc protease
MRSSIVLALTLATALNTPAGPATTSAAYRHSSPVSADTTTSDFEVNGLHVILRRNTATDVVAANLFLLGGTQQLTPETQGIEAFLLAVGARGSQKFPGAHLRQETARLGSEISVGLTDDWSTYGLKAIRSTFDSSWTIFADRLLNPTLETADVELIKSQMLTGLGRQDLDPDALLSRLADSITFQHHVYGLATGGTEQAISAMSASTLRDYMRRTFVTSRMLLVVVGNVERQDLEHLVRSTFAKLPRGDYVWNPPPAAPSTEGVVLRPAKLPTNYLLGYYAGPPATSDDYTALRVATAVLSGRFFTEIRSKRNLSYAAEAPFLERALSTGGVYVTTVDPNTTLRIMRDEIDRLQTEVIDRAGLNQLVEQFITQYFMNNETDADQADFLARAAIYAGDYRTADDFVSDLRRVTPEDVRRVARVYMKGFSFAYVGDTLQVDRRLLQMF